LVKLARIQPRNFDELKRAGLSHGQIRRFGQEILSVLRRKPPELPEPPDHTRPPYEVTERYKALKSWRKEVAARRGVDSDIILPNAVLWKLAKSPPDDRSDLVEITGIGPWRRDQYGSDLLELTSN
jgi:ribonuclease D